MLQNWMKNNDRLVFSDNYSPKDNIKNIKILELILYLDISPVRFLYSLQNSKTLKNIKEMKRYDKTRSKKEFSILQGPVKYENHFLNFLYVYLKFVTPKEESFFEIYGIVVNILKQFESSWFPSTILWQLELASLVANKFDLDIKAHSKLKHDWASYLSEVMVKAMRIVNSEVKIVFNFGGQKYKMAMPFSPTSYGLLRKQAILGPKSHRIIKLQCGLKSRYCFPT